MIPGDEVHALFEGNEPAVRAGSRRGVTSYAPSAPLEHEQASAEATQEGIG